MLNIGIESNFVLTVIIYLFFVMISGAKEGLRLKDNKSLRQTLPSGERSMFVLFMLTHLKRLVCRDLRSYRYLTVTRVAYFSSCYDFLGQCEDYKVSYWLHQVCATRVDIAC